MRKFTDFRLSPSQQHSPDSKSRPYCRHQDEIAALETTARKRVVQRQRNSAGGGIAEPVDVDEDLFSRETELLCGGENNPAACLMRHEQIDVGPGEAVSVQNPATDLFHVTDRKLENSLTVLFHKVQPALHSVSARGHAAASSRHAERGPASAVHVVLEIENATVAV